MQFHLTRAFNNVSTSHNKWDRFWCDGIAIPDDQELYLSTIRKSKQIITKGWFGYDGQQLYRVTLKLGEQARAGYQNGYSLVEFVPSDETTDWITLDTENREIELRLQ